MEVKELKNPVGRPTLYDSSWMLNKVIEIGDNGGTVADICHDLGIKHKSTYYDWIDKYPEFKEAVEIAQLASEAWIARNFRGMISGAINPKGFAALAMYANNHAPETYRRSNAGSYTEVNLQQNNLVKQLENTDTNKLFERAKKLLEIPKEENNV